jgi:DNA (cytosine-5)-methyltransferase 1
MRPRLLDLFSGAGGASYGYMLAGFHVTGVDIRPQPRYRGDVFIQADALEYVAAHGHEYDCIAASPPCQGYSRMRHLPWLKGRTYPMLIEATRAALQATGKPYIIENVEGAPLENAVMLCGTMFGLKVYRHRLFETSFFVLSFPHTKHQEVIGHGRMLNDRERGNVNGFISLIGKDERAAAAVGIDWMTRDELAQAIPPDYTFHLGTQMLQSMEVAA